MTFDLEKARADLGEIGDPKFCDCEVRAQFMEAITEIERLRLLATFPKSESGLITGLCMAIRKTEEQAAEIERLRGEMENYGDDYVCQMKSKDARIKELEGALAEYQRLGKTIAGKVPDADECPDDLPPIGSPYRSWQITDERIRAIQWAEEMAGDCKAGDVLRAMLEEAGQ